MWCTWRTTLASAGRSPSSASLAFACDLVYATPESRFCEIFVRRGLALDCGSSWLLPRLIGMQKAKELFFYPDKLAAQQLVELGLANAVLPHGELLDYTRDRALQLVPPRGAGASIRAMKRIIHAQKVEALTRALDLENEALNELMQGEDFVEGIMARVEKREAVFKGR